MAHVAFFQDKRFGVSDGVMAVEGMNSMNFVDPGTRPRGIRAWERARFEADQRRVRELQYHQSIKAAKKSKVVPAPTVKPNTEVKSFEIPIRSNDSVVVPVDVYTGNDAWD